MKKLILSFILLLSLCTPTFAQVPFPGLGLVHAQAAGGGQTIFDSQETQNDYDYTCYSTVSYSMGQKDWQTGVQKVLTRVDVWVRNIIGDVSTRHFNVKVYLPSGNDLGTLQGTSDTVTGLTATSWNTFQFSTPVTLLASTSYDIVFGNWTESPDATNYPQIYHYDADGGKSGNMGRWQSDGSLSQQQAWEWSYKFYEGTP